MWLFLKWMSINNLVFFPSSHCVAHLCFRPCEVEQKSCLFSLKIPIFPPFCYWHICIKWHFTAMFDGPCWTRMCPHCVHGGLVFWVSSEILGINSRTLICQHWWLKGWRGELVTGESLVQIPPAAAGLMLVGYVKGPTWSDCGCTGQLHSVSVCNCVNVILSTVLYTVLY